MCPGFDVRLEKSQNLVSTNDPEVIESLRASCSGIGTVMSNVATPIVLQFFGIWDKLKEDTRFDFQITIVYLWRLRPQACIVLSRRCPGFFIAARRDPSASLKGEAFVTGIFS